MSYLCRFAASPGRDRSHKILMRLPRQDAKRNLTPRCRVDTCLRRPNPIQGTQSLAFTPARS